MKTKSDELNKIWIELEDILSHSNLKLSKNDIKRLENIGFNYVYEGKHPKIYFYVEGVKKIVVLSSSPSDNNSYKQALRQIRRYYENL